MSSNTESNFRNAFKNFGARGGVAAADTTASSSGSGSAFNRASDWFGGVRSQVSGYVPVSMGGGAQPQEEDWLGLSWFQVPFVIYLVALGIGYSVESLQWFIHPQLARNRGDVHRVRMAGFAICVAGGLACFMIAFFVGLPLFLLKPSKFATSFTLGSILLMTSFALLKGPAAHFKALMSRERLPFTGAYLGSMIFVLYSSLYLNNFILTIIGIVIEILALLYYFTSYSPFSGGSIRLGSRMASGLLPI